MFKKVILVSAFILSILANPAYANQKTYVVIGDSIMSFVGDGGSKDHATTLISEERDVVFKNISSPGASLGNISPFGYNSNITIQFLSQIDGYFGYFDGIIIQAGVNDFGQNIPWAQTAASLNAIMNYAQVHNKKVIMLDLLWMWNEATPNSTGWTLFNYRVGRSMICSAYASICTNSTRPPAFNGPSNTLFPASEVATGTQLHPNVAGQRIYANWIESVAASAGLF